jgi:hypothetical protein
MMPTTLTDNLAHAFGCKAQSRLALELRPAKRGGAWLIDPTFWQGKCLTPRVEMHGPIRADTANKRE